MSVSLVAGTGLGVRGAAYATVIAQSISALLCALYIARRAKILLPRRADFA